MMQGLILSPGIKCLYFLLQPVQHLSWTRLLPGYVPQARLFDSACLFETFEKRPDPALQ